MKFNKFFMLAVAGLAMTACSSDEEVGNNLSGNGVVEVKIAAPQLRALVDATPGTNGAPVKVEGQITVKLTATKGSAEKTVEIKDGVVQPVKFYDVQGPSKVEAWVNGGNTNGTGQTNIDEQAMQVLPKNIPAYGSSSTINLTGKTETSDGKKYEMYGATVQMNIPVARLEISGIKHVHASEAKGCKYKELSIDGIYLDKVSPTLGVSAVDYSWPAVEGGAHLPILREEITTNTNFLMPNGIWPEASKAYAFNFYPNKNQQPIVKIYFAKATASDEANPVSQPRYAVIKSYNNDPQFKFEAQKIYRITAVNLDDKNIIGDEEGNTLYGVDVTVTEAQWSVVDITGEWQEQ